MLIGAGGAARAVAFGLVHQGTRLSIVNRTENRAQELARATGAEHSGGLHELDKLGDYDVLVNASSMGMASVADSSLVGSHQLREGMVVMDIVYDPAETKLIKQAREAGATAITGLRMLLHQAARQFELYTGQSAPLDVMDGALRGVGSS